MNLRIAIVFSVLVVPAHAAVIKVSKNGAVTSIQAGVDLAQAGDTVEVKKGVFGGRVVVPVGKDGLTLKGSTGAILDAFDVAGGAGLTILSDDVTVTGLTIRNAVSGAVGPGRGVLASGDRIRMRKSVVESCDSDGIRVDGSDPTIEACRFTGVSAGCEIDGGGVSRVKNCRFERCGFGVDLETTGSAIVEGSRFATLDFDAIKGAAGGTVDVLSCTFRDVGISCVTVDANGDLTIANSSVDNTRSAFVVSGSLMTIRKNKIRHILDDAGAIRVDAGTVDVRDNDIDGCNASGIVVGLSAIGTVTANKVKRTATLSLAAIQIEATSNVDVTDNQLSKIGGDGIRVTAGDGGAMDIEGNTIQDCARDGIDVGATAIGVVVADNLVRRCFAEGIENSGQATSVENNDVKQCRIDLANDGAAVFVANVFTTGGAAVAPEVD